jgi:hypothetical protein
MYGGREEAGIRKEDAFEGIAAAEEGTVGWG